jgi:photosystem II stability/assembly factor-like uncharacterized protein
MSFKKFLMITTLLLSFFCFSKVYAQDLWEPAGISGGAISSIVKVNANILIAGYSGGGLYRSTDGGINWYSISKKVNNISVFVLKVSSAGDIYAGTGRSIFKSTDQGVNWNKVDNSFPVNGYASDIVFDASGNVYAANDYGGVYKSIDGGNSWTQINSGLPSSRYITNVGFTSNNILLASDLYRGVYKSTDFGASWVKASTGLDSTYYVTSFNSNSSGEIFLTTAGNGPFKSIDNGDSWFSIKGDLALNYCSDIDFNSSGDLFLTIVQQLYKSTNGGANWSNITTMFNGFGFISSYVDDNNNLWACTQNSGVVKSTDGGNNWDNYVNGLTSTFIQSLRADASGNLYATISGKALYSSTNNGVTWNIMPIVNSNEDTFIRTVAVIPSGGLIVYNVYNGIYITTDFSTWTSFSTGLTTQSIKELAVSNNYYFAAGYDGKIYRSPRTSANWIEITDTISPGYCYDLFVSASGDLYYLFDEYIYKSTNNGDNWVDVGNGVNGYSFSIAQNSFGDIFVGTDRGVYRSTDAGTSWIKDVSGLTDGALSLAIYGGTTVFAGGYQSISRSNDFGQTWAPFTTGIENRQINNLVMGRSDVLIASAEYLGVYRTTSSVTSIENGEFNQVKDFALDQNYPNPFNPSTTINWQSPVGSWQTLKVYDVLGNEVAVLVNEFKEAGAHKIDFDASNLVSGVYFYKLQVGSFIETKKMILLR